MKFCVLLLFVLFQIGASFILKRSSHFTSVPNEALISPNEGENMRDYRKAVMKGLKEQSLDDSKLGGRELLSLIVTKWGLAHDVQLRKLKPFGDGSENIYVNIMWYGSF